MHLSFALLLPLLLPLSLAHSSDHTRPDHAAAKLAAQHLALQRDLRARAAASSSTLIATTTKRAASKTSTTATPTSTEATSTLPMTFAAGATPPVYGAPPLPDLSTINENDYPPLDVLPPLNSTEMLQWISEIDMANIPNIPPTGIDGCANTTYNQGAILNAGPEGNCWWTCGHCTRDTDITFCPTQSTWGLSYDDGPSPSTPKLLDFLYENDLLATFFVVGSRAVSRPQMLQTAYMMGHQISVHTWAHSSLTTLTNEGIIAELAWSKAIIKAVTGVTPNTMRPPYGDIDDRVRYICAQLGLTPIIWTVDGSNSYDTQDWEIAGGIVTADQVLTNFENIITNSTELDTGFIVLEHDLDSTAVDLAVNQVLPAALSFSPSLTLQPIITCLGQPSYQAYQETFQGYTSDRVARNGSESASGSSSSISSGGTGTAVSAQQTSKTVTAGAEGRRIEGVHL
ncbi:chitin deacetylase, carbohydrate esterase family 4 protein [Pseudohyphozyma bogoriensis]|nr:chitin deacetylase, carbohydrate esterase family 4 protein [Pseudohyphozyma bogoriensis]